MPYDTGVISVFEGGISENLLSFAEHDPEDWASIRLLRDDVNKALEIARNDKLVGASLDAEAYIFAPEGIRSLLDKLDGDKNILQPPVKTNGVDELRTILMLSHVNLVDSASDVSEVCDEKYMLNDGTSGCVVGVKKSIGEKCQRCWFYDTDIGKTGLQHSELCARCNDAIFQWEKETNQTFTLPEPEPVAQA